MQPRKKKKSLLRQGFVQLYTGQGKGKTTAALGQALRILGAGGSVFFGQFLKGRKTSESKLLGNFPECEFKQFGRNHFLGPIANPRDKRLAQRGADIIREKLLSEQYDLVVADEVCVAIHLGLIPESVIIEWVAVKPRQVELILTGRHASPALKKHAALVTEMREIRHYFNLGIPARNGIEY